MNQISEQSELQKEKEKEANLPEKRITPNKDKDMDKRLQKLLESAKPKEETPRYQCHNPACQSMHSYRGM